MLKTTKNLKLQDFSSMKVGNQTLCDLYEIDEISDIGRLVDEKVFEEKFFIHGSGTNTVFVTSEKINLLKVNLKDIVFSGSGYKVGAGVVWDEFIQRYVKDGGVGMEALSIIPGTVGASPVQNIGAYGVEVCEFIESVLVYNVFDKKFETLLNKDCDFSYRNSTFKKNPGKYIVLYVNFKLVDSAEKKLEYKNKIVGYKDLIKYFNLNEVQDKNTFLNNITTQNVRKAIIDIRNQKFPNIINIPNCGSFFGNPIVSREKLEHIQKIYPDVPVFAVVGMGDKADEKDKYVKIPFGYILEKMGYKGKMIGHFGMHKNHALLLTNNLIAESYGDREEFLEFVKNLKTEIYNNLHLEVEPEVNII